MSTHLAIAANDKQLAVLSNVTAQEGYVEGGWGSGKTWGLAHKAINLSAANGRECAGIVVTLTHTLKETVILPEFDKAFRLLGRKWKYVGGSKSVITWDGGGKMWLRTAEHPERLEGPNLAWGVGDEAGQWSEEVFTRLVGRIRDVNAKVSQLIFFGRPEGTRTKFNHNIGEVTAGVRPTAFHVRLRTMDNQANLKESYVDNIKMAVAGDEAMAQQVLEGVAADASGNIYGTIPERCIGKCANPALGDVTVGWDFNNNHMVTPVGTWFAKTNTLHIWGEVVSAEQTTYPGMSGHGGAHKVDAQGAKIWEHADRVAQYLLDRNVVTRSKGHLVSATRNVVDAYCDATGGNRDTGAEKSDLAVVEEKGFRAKHDPRNPRVRVRIAEVRLALERGTLKIDPAGAPLTFQALQGHAYDKWGDPQKWSGPSSDLPLDHYTDALGYMVHGLMPIQQYAHVPSRR